MANQVGDFGTGTIYFRSKFFGHLFMGRGFSGAGHPYLGLLTNTAGTDGPLEIGGAGYQRIPLLMLPPESAGVGVNDEMVFPKAGGNWDYSQFGIFEGPDVGDKLWWYCALTNSPQIWTGVATDPATIHTVPPGRRLRVPRRTITCAFTNAFALGNTTRGSGVSAANAAAIYNWLLRGGSFGPFGTAFSVNLLDDNYNVVGPSSSCTITDDGFADAQSGHNDADIVFAPQGSDYGPVFNVLLGGTFYGAAFVFQTAPFSGSRTIKAGQTATIPMLAGDFGVYGLIVSAG